MNRKLAPGMDLQLFSKFQQIEDHDLDMIEPSV
jgi:hypothetical protein